MRQAAIATFGTTILIVLLTLATSVLLARSLGPEGRGLLLAFTFWPALLSGLTNLSLNEATAYHVGRCDGAGDALATREFEASSLLLQLLLASSSSAICLFFMDFIFTIQDNKYRIIILIYAGLFAPLSILDQHFRAILQGRGQFRLLNAIRLIQPATYASLLFFLVIVSAVTVENVMAVMLMSLTVSPLLALAKSRPTLSSASLATSKILTTAGLRFHAANVLLYAAAEIDKLLVLQLVDIKLAGQYAIALGVSGIGSSFVVQSVGIILSREVSATLDNHRRGELIVYSVQIATTALGLINISAAALAPWWLPIMFGPKFSPAVPVAMVLLIMNTFRGVRQVLDRGMRAANVTSIGVTGEALALSLTLLLATVGWKNAGLVGLSAGLAVSQAMSCLGMIYLAARRFDLSPFQFSPLQRNFMALVARQMRTWARTEAGSRRS